MLTVWFIDKHLNLAYGLNGVAPCIAALMGGYFSPRLFGTTQDPHLGRALFMGVMLTAISLVFLVPMIMVDRKRVNEEEEIKQKRLEELKEELLENGEDGDELDQQFNEQQFKCSDLKKFGKLFWLNLASGCF